MKHLFKISSGLLMALLMSVLLSVTLDMPPVMSFGLCLGLSVLLGFINSRLPKHQKGILADLLLTEVWTSELEDRFFDDDNFLADGKDWTPFVDNDAINTQEIGVSPNVVINRTVYPVPVTPRDDTPIRLLLEDYSTDSTVIHDAQEVATNYDKRQSVIADHKSVLLEKIADHGIYNIAPTTNTVKSPIIKTSGAISAQTGNRILSSDDIMRMNIEYDKNKYPKIGRTLVVDPTMFWEFINTNDILKRQAELNGAGGNGTDLWVSFMGFTIKSRVTTAMYDKTTLTKSVYGAVPGANDKKAAIAYIKGKSFGKGLGTNKMYATIGDPANQGDIINFRQRAIVLPVRQATLGAIIYSN
jgi:hypothetical protein